MCIIEPMNLRGVDLKLLVASASLREAFAGWCLSLCCLAGHKRRAAKTLWLLSLSVGSVVIKGAVIVLAVTLDKLRARASQRSRDCGALRQGQRMVYAIVNHFSCDDCGAGRCFDCFGSRVAHWALFRFLTPPGSGGEKVPVSF
jgi:hypothetical protein